MITSKKAIKNKLLEELFDGCVKRASKVFKIKITQEEKDKFSILYQSIKIAEEHAEEKIKELIRNN